MKERVKHFREMASKDTKAFYRCILKKGGRAKVEALMDEDGTMHYDNQNKMRILTREWQKIYDTRSGEKDLTRWFQKQTLRQQDIRKMDIPTLEKILDTLTANKALGEDG